MRHLFRLRFPIHRTEVVIPKTALHELMPQFIVKEFQVGKWRLPAELAEVVADFVLPECRKSQERSDERPPNFPAARATAARSVSCTKSSATSALRVRRRAYR